MHTTIRRSGLAVLLCLAGGAVPEGAVASPARDARGSAPSGLAAVRQATAQYRNVKRAKADGYAVLKDAQGIACIDMPGEGAMGVHYVKGKLVETPAVKAATPEALVYAPKKGGGLRLVAVEYVVFQEAWDAEHADPPKLFGREFELVPAGNRFDLPAFYALHAWVWKKNPSGMFAAWNPRVRC